MRTAIALTAVMALGAAIPTPGNNEAAWGDVKTNIKHVIYLMLENHSFDNIAGYWSFNPAIDNIVNSKKRFCNEYTNPNWTVYGEPLLVCANPYEPEIPLKDPDHDFAGVSYQIYRKWNPTGNDIPDMSGFVERQSEKYGETPGEAAFVINAYDEKKSSTLAELAQNFAFFDTYFAEHPGPTNPNRQFATSGSSCGYVDNTNQSAGWFNNVTGTDCAVSIFESLSKKGISWKNYYEGEITDAFLYKWVQDNAMDQIVHASQIFSDIQNGTLPQFSYYNPECCNVTSMHPLSNMAAGEQMVKHLYDAIRNSKYWDNVLLILNFDEHGGFYDHVPPPVNIPAPEDGITFTGVSDGQNVSYDFTRLGVRVPAFLISPWIPANTLIHSEGTSYAANSAYTHSSILHFLQELWDLDGLNNRVQWAKTFEYVFSSAKRDDTPARLSTPTWYGGSLGQQPYPHYLLNQPYSYYVSIGA